jgi:hypothetical protein
MKAISITKRWTLMSLLFLGISLMVYADAPRVVLSNVIVSNVTSNSADLEFAYLGATRWIVSTSATPGGTYTPIYDKEIPSDSSTNYSEKYYMRDLMPNTTYYVEIQVVGTPDPKDPGNPDLFKRERKYVYFTTESAPE